jgi:coenzyme F420-reducing hydrogenase delta subunit
LCDSEGSEDSEDSARVHYEQTVRVLGCGCGASCHADSTGGGSAGVHYEQTVRVLGCGCGASCHADSTGGGGGGGCGALLGGSRETAGSCLVASIHHGPLPSLSHPVRAAWRVARGAPLNRGGWARPLPPPAPVTAPRFPRWPVAAGAAARQGGRSSPG